MLPSTINNRTDDAVHVAAAAEALVDVYSSQIRDVKTEVIYYNAKDYMRRKLL